MSYFSKSIFKKYQTSKIDKYFKNNTFFFFFQSSKSNQWKKNEQELKKLKLQYYKVINKLALKIIQKSIYKKYGSLINGIILFIKTNSKITQINSYVIKRKLTNNFELLSLKLNNKIYSADQIKSINIFSYTKSMFLFYKSLEKYSKISYIIIK